MRFALMFCISLIVAPTFGQSGLYFSRNNKMIVSYHAGDKLTFRLKGEKFYTSQMIVGFQGDRIKFHYFDLELDEIDRIDISNENKNAIDVLSRLTFQAGVLFILIDIFNQGVIRNEGYEPTSASLIISGSLLATSGLAKLLSKKKFKIDGRKYKLQTL